jgi:hypothetical protein
MAKNRAKTVSHFVCCATLLLLGQRIDLFWSGGVLGRGIPRVWANLKAMPAVTMPQSAPNIAPKAN